MPLALLVFRHAKSGWEAPTDHERTLTEHGQQQAMFMGDLLKEKNIKPDFILCSSAVRARMTMDLAMKTGEIECDSNITDALYNTTVDNTIQILRQLSDQDKVVMLIGHEPTWSELTTSLTSEPASFSTAGLACIEFDNEQWKDVGKNKAKLKWYEHP